MNHLKIEAFFNYKIKLNLLMKKCCLNFVSFGLSSFNFHSKASPYEEKIIKKTGSEPAKPRENCITFTL